MDLGLRGRKALITGASKGIGRACAEILAEEGCDVAFVSRTAADLEKARAEIAGKYNVGVRIFALDLSDGRNVDTVAAECADIDILVNNAGAIPGGNIEAIDEKRWREAWDLKVFGYINMTRRFYAQMRDRRHGVIVQRARRGAGRKSRFRLHRRLVGQRVAKYSIVEASSTKRTRMLAKPLLINRLSQANKVRRLACGRAPAG